MKMHFLFPSGKKPQNALQKLICLFSDNNGGILETVKASPLSTPSLEPRSRKRENWNREDFGTKFSLHEKENIFGSNNSGRESTRWNRKSTRWRWEKGFWKSCETERVGNPLRKFRELPHLWSFASFFVSCIFLCSFHSASTSTYLYVCVFSIMW